MRSRALITMFDRRTRYSRIVLEKVKAEFQTDVFETVIRYNIRLRETADFGLPVGDFDKHSIGHADYENLADEILRSDADQIYECHNTMNAAQDILQKTEEYIDEARELTVDELPTSEMEELSDDEPPVSEPDEFPAYSSQSNYSQMIEAITADSGNSYLNDKKDID
jgi:hypothetical protein